MIFLVGFCIMYRFNVALILFSTLTIPHLPSVLRAEVLAYSNNAHSPMHQYQPAAVTSGLLPPGGLQFPLVINNADSHSMDKNLRILLNYLNGTGGGTSLSSPQKPPMAMSEPIQRITNNRLYVPPKSAYGGWNDEFGMPKNALENSSYASFPRQQQAFMSPLSAHLAPPPSSFSTTHLFSSPYQPQQPISPHHPKYVVKIRRMAPNFPSQQQSSNLFMPQSDAIDYDDMKLESENGGRGGAKLVHDSPVDNADLDWLYSTQRPSRDESASEMDLPEFSEDDELQSKEQTKFSRLGKSLPSDGKPFAATGSAAKGSLPPPTGRTGNGDSGASGGSASSLPNRAKSSQRAVGGGGTNGGGGSVTKTTISIGGGNNSQQSEFAKNTNPPSTVVAGRPASTQTQVVQPAQQPQPESILPASPSSQLPPPSTSPHNFKLIYFDARGICEPIRLLFHYAKVPFEDSRITRRQWLALKDSTVYGKVPILEVDGKPLTYCHTISRFLARTFGLAGTSLWEQSKVDEISDFHSDVAMDLQPYLYVVAGFHQGDREALRKAIFLPGVEKHFPVYVNILKQSGSGYFVTSGLTWVDFVISEYMTTIKHFEPAILDKYPAIMKFVRKVQSQPQIFDYIANREHQPVL